MISSLPDIHNIFRSAPHCIEYAHLIQWGKERPTDDFDPDIEEHMNWVYEKAVLRAEQFGIPVRPNLDDFFDVSLFSWTLKSDLAK